jgi:DNA-binding NarL/FixJ family response regulator
MFARHSISEEQLAAGGRVRKELRVLLWLEDSLLRDVLVTAIRRVEGLDLVLATDAEGEALEVVSRGTVDLIAFDADGESVSRLQRSAEAFRAAAPQVRLVVLTSSRAPASIQELLTAGVDSAISKSILTSDFGYVLRQSGRNTFFDASIGTDRPIVRELPVVSPVPTEAARPEAGGTSPLTTREREILALVSEGTGNKQIAKKLWVTEQTVKFHLSNIYRKLQVSNRTEASRIAHATGLISLSALSAHAEPVAGTDGDTLDVSHG